MMQDQPSRGDALGRLLGMIIGLGLTFLIIGVFLSLIGGGLLAALAAVITLPLAFPLTTVFILAVFAVLWLRRRVVGWWRRQRF